MKTHLQRQPGSGKSGDDNGDQFHYLQIAFHFHCKKFLKQFPCGENRFHNALMLSCKLHEAKFLGKIATFFVVNACNCAIVLFSTPFLTSMPCLNKRLQNLTRNSISKQVKRMCYTKEKALVSKSAKVFSVSQTAEDFPLSQTENKMTLDDFAPRTILFEEFLTLFLLRIDSELVLHAPVWGSR